tara:strand:+ start:91 stop:2721 length:2631 start_codon:yes stop_codon:yes gene_type:complete
MAKFQRFDDKVLYQPQTRAQGFSMPSAPDLTSQLRQNQQAMLQEQKSQAAANKLDMDRRGQILKANKLVEDMGAANLLALTEGGRKFLEGGVEAFGQYQEEEAASAFVRDLEAQADAREEYEAEQRQFSALDNEAEKLALEAQRNNAPQEVVSSYGQLWGRGRRQYEQLATQHFGNPEMYSQFVQDKLQSEDTIKLPDGTEIALNKPNKTNTEFAAVRSAIKDMYMEENGLNAIINRRPGLAASKLMPGILQAERKISAQYEKERADNESFATRSNELNTLVSNYSSDPLALSHYLNIVSTTTRDGRNLGMRGAWNQLQSDLLEVAASGKDITGIVNTLRTQVMPNDPKGRTYDEMHGTKLSVIVAKALDEERKIFRRDSELQQREFQNDLSVIAGALGEGSTKEEILEAKDAATKAAHMRSIYNPNLQVFDRMLNNPVINGDLERELIITASHDRLAEQGLLTVEEVQKYPGIKGYNNYLNQAINQEKTYSANGGLKDTLKAVEADVKKDNRIKLYGKVGELGGTAMMMVGHYQRHLSARVAQLMLNPEMDVVTANSQAFQEFQAQFEKDTNNPNHQFYFQVKRGEKGGVGFINYNANRETNKRLFDARVRQIVTAAQKDPDGFLSTEGLFGDEQFWTKATRGMGQPGWRPDGNLVRMARQLNVPVLDIYKRQVENYPNLPQPTELLKQVDEVRPELKKFFNDYLSGVASRAAFTRVSGQPPVRSMFAGMVGNDQLSRLKRAFISQESGGDHNAVNRRTGALGLVQVMPENVGSFTQQYLGKAYTYVEFKNNRAAQELLATRLFEDMLAKHTAPGRSEEEIIRRIAAEHYGGPGAVEYWDSHQYHAKGSQFNPYGAEPDMAEYTKSVYRKYRGGQ